MQLELIQQLSSEQIRFARKALLTLRMFAEISPTLRSNPTPVFHSNDLHFGTAHPMMWIGETPRIREGTNEILMEISVKITNNQEETAIIPADVFMELTEEM